MCYLVGNNRTVLGYCSTGPSTVGNAIMQIHINIGYVSKYFCLKSYFPKSTKQAICLSLLSLSLSIYIYEIMKTMYPPGFHHNGFVATHANGHEFSCFFEI